MNSFLKKFTLVTGFAIILIGMSLLLLKTPFVYLFTSGTDVASGKIARAIEILEEGAKKYPANEEINFSLAMNYLLVGETNKANNILIDKSLDKLLGANKNFQDFLVDLSEANYSLGQNKFVERFSMLYFELHNDKEITRRQARNYMKLGQILPERSLELLEKAYNIASRLKGKELKESIKTLLLPKYYEIVESHRANKEHDKALEVLTKAKKIGNTPNVNYLKAQVYSELGKMQDAEPYFDEALEQAPGNVDYKIAYVTALQSAALNESNSQKRADYLEKIMLLVSDKDKFQTNVSFLNRIINLNAKYKITDGKLVITKIGDYFYPSIAFKIEPVSDVLLRRYKVVFYDKDQNQLDQYEAPVTKEDVEKLLEVTCRNPLGADNLVTARLFLNNELVSEYSNR